MQNLCDVTKIHFKDVTRRMMSIWGKREILTEKDIEVLGDMNASDYWLLDI